MQGQVAQVGTLALWLAALSSLEKLPSALPSCHHRQTRAKVTSIPHMVLRPELQDWCFVTTKIPSKEQPFLAMGSPEGSFRKSNLSIHKIVTLR